jgi:DNA-binding NtrC family response regulator
MQLAQMGRSRAEDRELQKPERADLEAREPEILEPELIRPELWMLGPMAGRSPVMQHLFARMRCTAPHFRIATVEGEPGSGKMIAAQTLHGIGAAAAGPFAPCTAAAFVENCHGLWREARGGMLYLARADELSIDEQRRLRDFLERAAHERMRMHVAAAPMQVVAGSSQPLRRLAAAGKFRSDLASHLTAIRFTLPPLRERREDIPFLAGLFLRDWIACHGKTLRGFSPGTLGKLTAHTWPGNVRELESVVGTAALETTGQWIRPIDIPRLEWPARVPDGLPNDAMLDDPNLDRAILHHALLVLARVNGNKVRAAQLLGISRSTLYRLLENDGTGGIRDGGPPQTSGVPARAQDSLPEQAVHS